MRTVALGIFALVVGACSEGGSEPGFAETGAAVAPVRPAAVAMGEAPAGKEAFDHWCLPCHDAGPHYPGTMALKQRVGEARAVLLERADLTEEYVKLVVRNGFNMMPPLKPTELTDSELERVAAHVASAGKQQLEQPVSR